MTLAELRAGLAATLTAAGIRATTDPRTVNPPCVLIGLAQGERLTGCAFRGTIAVSVVAPGAGHGDAAAWLDDTASTVAALLGANAWAPDGYPLPDVLTDGLLQYVLTVPAAWDVPAA